MKLQVFTGPVENLPISLTPINTFSKKGTREQSDTDLALSDYTEYKLDLDKLRSRIRSWILETQWT